jgi:truncated hemoglobin YjbI
LIGVPENLQHSILLLLGGEAGCRKLSQVFYARVAAESELKALFPGKSLRCATEEFAAFLIQFFEGDPAQTQYRWWLSLQESHARFQISDWQRAVWLGQMGEALAACVEDSGARTALAQFFETASGYLVTQDEAEVEHPELRQRWAKQRILDQLIDDLKAGRDAEAIELSRQFKGRPSALVGILASMLKADRSLLSEYVEEIVREDAQLAEAGFNGRPLLHFAASAASVGIVRQLLGQGVDPNLRESGGHTALYRAAGKRDSEDGAQVVAELVRAGADVNLAGGVSRATPLHQAARFGNLRVAEALLKAGADPLARDKRGFTPLDRARNCRRPQVLELLSQKTRGF